MKVVCFLFGALFPVLGACTRAPRAADMSAQALNARFVTVQPNVTLEVLDSGGPGEPLVFLAGFGNSAHIFERFAARFRDQFRVVAVTRRGFGRSSQPATGYDNARLVDDVARVMDSLGIARAVLVAHSFGGAELNGLALRHPGRMRALVYLDGGFDFAELYADSAWVNTPIPRPPRDPALDASPESEAAYLSLMTGPGYPVAEVIATTAASEILPEDGFRRDSLPAWLMRGTPPAALSRIAAPVLALYGVQATVEEKYPWFGQLSAAQQMRAARRFDVEAPLLVRQRERFRREIPHVEVREITGARHYIFLTHPEDSERAIREFIAGLPAS